MEKSVTTGMQPEDFSGHCPTCSVECQEDILKLVGKFCQGLAVELTGASLSGLTWQPDAESEVFSDISGWPSFIVSGGGDANSFVEVASKREVKQGDIRFGYSHLYEDDHPILSGHCPEYGPRGPYPVRFPSNSGFNWTQRHTDHIDSLSNADSSTEQGIDDIIEGVPDFALNSVTTVIETIDLYSTEEHFAIFPVCGKLRVEDSGTDYIPIRGCLTETVLDTDGNPVNRGWCTTQYDTTALHILVSSDCPDPHIAKTSEHPHMVGRSSEPDTVGTYNAKRENPAYSDKRECDNVEQKMYLGMCRTTYAVKVGSVFKTTISGAFDGDHVYYTSIHPVGNTSPPTPDHPYGKGVDISYTDAEKAEMDICPSVGTSNYTKLGGVLYLPPKRYNIDSYDPNWLDYCTPEWADTYGRGGYVDYSRRTHELGCWVQCPYNSSLKDSRGYYYCGRKLDDLAELSANQKKFIFASKQDAIDSMNTQVSRQKLQAHDGIFFTQTRQIPMASSPVGCFQSQLVTFAGGASVFGNTISSGDGVSIVEMENEAFSISGSILYNRDKTKKYDLKDGLWDDAGSTTSSEMTYGDRDPIVGVTFYETELSHHTFSDKVELKTDHDIVWNNIYERSLGFGSATVPDGYATGGYSKKSNLDTPEKALKAWTFPRWGGNEFNHPTWFTNADLDMAGFFYRWAQDKYYYDAEQQACDFSTTSAGVHSLGQPYDCPPAPGAEARAHFDRNLPQAQITTTVCQAGSPSAPFPPRFDVDQRVHGDGTIDFDDFSYATKTVKNVYTEDPNNPDFFDAIDESICAPNCSWYGYDYYEGQYGFWRLNGTYEDQEQWVQGAKCLTTETLPDQDYDYYIYRPKIKVMPDPHHPDAGIFDWRACGEEYSGYGDKWPCTTCWGIDRHDTTVYERGWSYSYRGAEGCFRCMSSRYIPSGHVMVPGREHCSKTWCSSGYATAGEPHSPYEEGYIWYTEFADDREYSYRLTPYMLTSCCYAYCLKCHDSCWDTRDGNCGGASRLCTCLDYGPSTVTDTDMGCRLIKIPKTTSAIATSSVGLGSLSIKVSLK